MLIAILHHPLKEYCGADVAQDMSGETASVLGLVPHQIRGFLSHFNTLLITGNAYDKCTACSAKVVEEYRAKGFAFLLEVFNNPSYLEDLTGLTELKQATQDISIEWEVDDEEEIEM